MTTGTLTTYANTAQQKRSIGDLINMIDWTEAPLLRLLGTNNEKKFRLVNWPRTKCEWLEDEMSPRAGTLAEIASAAETEIDLASGQGSYLKEGDVIKVESELIYVSAVSTDTITAVRGFGGTTDAEHASATAWTLMTSARLEGADADTGHTTTLDNPYNHTQILSEGVKVTGSEEKDSKYGISDTMAYHIQKLIGGGNGMGSKGTAGKLSILLEQTFFDGRRAAGSSTLARAMGGFKQYVTTNTTAVASAALKLKHIEDTMQACFDAGGKPETIVCGSWGRRKISNFFKGAIRTDRDEKRGGAKITTIETDFGDLEVMWSRWCPRDEMYIFEKDKMGWVTFRPFDIYDRASTGDYKLKEVLGEFSFVLANEAAHGLITGFSLTK
jgi:hypothetical protein